MRVMRGGRGPLGDADLIIIPSAFEPCSLTQVRGRGGG